MNVVLYTTMLDMHMGTGTLNVQPDGEGRFKSQIDLSMGGLWQVCVVIQTADHKSHEACVKVLIPY